MDQLYEYVKNTFVKFKLDTCCCVAPIRIGLLFIGYFNILISMLSLVGTADDGYTPPLMDVQAVILEDDFSKPLGIVAYATELAFNMLLLCGIYRNDIKLLWTYIYFVIVSIISSVLVYSIVFIRISALTKTLIICILAFQCYVIVLVRSLIVEIKETRTSEKNGHVTLYSVAKMPDDVLAHSSDYPISEVIIDKTTQKEHQNIEDYQKSVTLQKNEELQNNVALQNREEVKNNKDLQQNEVIQKCEEVKKNEVQKTEEVQKNDEIQTNQDLVKNEKFLKVFKGRKNEKQLKDKKKKEKYPEPKNDESTSTLETVKEDLKEMK